MVSGSMACPIQNTERLQSAQVQKAWHALSNLQISCRNYPKPGKTLLVKDVSAEYSPDVGRTDLPSTCNIDKSCAHMQTHQYINGTNTRNSEAATFLGNLLPSSNFNVADPGKNLGRKVRSEHQWSTVLMLGCWMDHLATIVFIPAKGKTLQKFLLITWMTMMMTYWRLQLNKQIQQLEKYLCNNSLDEERRKSHFSASTPRPFQCETPQAAAFRTDPMRFDS